MPSGRACTFCLWCAAPSSLGCRSTSAALVVAEPCTWTQDGVGSLVRLRDPCPSRLKGP